MTADRRPTLTIFEQGIVNNIYKNQWRAIVFWLKPDTLYEVKVIYTDLDGVSGSNIVTATTRTRTDNPPSIGRVYYVSVSGSDNNDGLTTGTAFGTIQKTANIVNPGDRVLILPGVYNEGIRIIRSGTADNYITFQSYDLNNKAVLDTPASWPSSRENEKNNIFLGGADYIRIKGLDLRNAADSNIGTNHDGFGGAFSDNVIIEDNILSNAGTDWRDSGVSIIGESSNFIIQRNQILRNNTYSGEPMGVWFSGLPGGHIFRENRVIGCFKDGVGGGPNFAVDGGPGANTFIYNNYIEGAWDDGIEAEGGGINMAIWGNIIKGRVCSGGQVMNMGLGIAPVTVGPAYIFRNTVFDFADAAMKLGSSSYGFIYLYHNTFYTTQAGAQGPSTFGSDANIGNIVSRNNVYYPYRRALNIYGPVDRLSLSFDYDNLSNGGRYSSLLRWGTVAYNSLTAFQSATGLERNGLSEDSQFVDASKGDLRLQPRSPNIDKGLVLPGFNDANSPWPYSGNAPDLGALEYSAR